MSDAAGRISDKACVYATGSFERLEAGPESDLDLFIVGIDTGDRKKKLYKSALSNLDATLVKADLISTTRLLGIKDFDGDGKYIAHFSAYEIIDSLGEPDDDVKNTLTSRLLMLLESTPLLGEGVYKIVIDDLLEKYWRDYADHKDDFVPAFFGNDILRLWRTFCVNYEARTEREPEDLKKKGKIKNYKLKHSRMLTCYSALLYMLEVYREKKSFDPDDARHMVSMTPTQRLEWLIENSKSSEAKEQLTELLTLYDEFLKSTSDEKLLGDRLMDPQLKEEYAKSTYKFGDTMFKAMTLIGGESKLHRLLVV
ncbi:nucleotidyltransferase domain-containing protein [Methylorubrum extorquens]